MKRILLIIHQIKPSNTSAKTFNFNFKSQENSQNTFVHWISVHLLLIQWVQKDPRIRQTEGLKSVNIFLFE